MHRSKTLTNTENRDRQKRQRARVIKKRNRNKKRHQIVKQKGREIETASARQRWCVLSPWGSVLGDGAEVVLLAKANGGKVRSGKCEIKML